MKNFTANYIDIDEQESTRTYSMFVRDLDLDVRGAIDPIEEDFLNAGVERKIKINSSEIKEIFLGDAYPILIKDIAENRSRKICTYIGQED